MKNPSIQVNKDAYDEDKEIFSEDYLSSARIINIQDGNIGLQLQVPRGGANPNGVGSELTIFFARISFLLQLVSFTVDSDPTVTDGGCEQTHPHNAYFLAHSFAHMHLHGSRCCGTCLCKKSAHTHVITCLIVRCLSTH